ncbi:MULTISPECIES: SDR family NAD(P)-dependent oxidoreductase [unclassified Novosphingobium]|uniref:SDR family NAD(P)-dependent oxidoreductase n=1 Tax=unclassified Novosphingobium TaxID=2644732 RepID=UPI000EDFD454|nr:MULTISPECIES: SDR family NAD(P)-dependent oxidoreductase [unclassified Novosphingobium]HCF24682.1 dehydrogenase [Novosphingobium sp.]HQV04905.1 SDR family NAD(P)-dependent oxidoreductase [Novosphingobium sp.]
MTEALTVSAAVITGGASGIGLAVSEELGRRGAAVMLADRDGDALAEAGARLNDAGIKALGQVCDVADLASVEALAEAAFAAFGQVDLVFNNAGVGGPRGKLWEVDPEVARAHFDINFWGVWHGCRAFAPRLAAQQSPSAIYNTGSENSLFCAVPHTAAYIAAKHAVLGLTESLREDLPGHVHAGLVIPGWVHTAIGPDAVMRNGMAASRFAEIIVPQILACERFVVAHAYNVVRIHERIDALYAAFAEHAPRYDGDDEYDVRSVIAKLRQERQGQ